jgi:hypothetical protein
VGVGYRVRDLFRDIDEKYMEWMERIGMIRS